MFAYFHAYYVHFFSKLTDGSLFVCQAANLWQVKTLIQKRLAAVSGEINDPVQSIDTVPLPVCVITGAGRDRHFHGEADFGYCPAEDMHYCGFKLGLRVSRAGMITNYALLQARPHDIQFLETLMEDFEGCAPADKRFIDEFRHSILLDLHNILVVTPPGKNMKSTLPEHLVRFCRRIRKRGETAGPQLPGCFKADRIRTRDLWHFQHRLIRKILAHVCLCFP